MKLVSFETKYGRRVIGGRFNFARSPSTSDEINAPLEIVDSVVVEQYEKDHAAALLAYRKQWNLE